MTKRPALHVGAIASPAQYQQSPPQPITPPINRPISIAPPVSVIDAHHYLNLIDAPARLEIPYAPQLIIHKNDKFRNFLAITYISGLTTTPGLFPQVLIGFGRAPDLMATFRMLPGITIGWDEGVPQDDIWIGWDTNDPVAAGYTFSNVGYTYSVVPQ